MSSSTHTLTEAHKFALCSLSVSQTCRSLSLALTVISVNYYAPFNLGQQTGFAQPDNADPENACRTELTIPTWLEDGGYVLQWVLYGVHMGVRRFI